LITFDLLKNHPHHIPELAQLMFDEWGEYYPNSSLEIMLKWLHKTTRQSGLPLTMLALDEEKIVGCAMVQNHELYREKGVTPWLGGLLVKNDYQHQGIGEHLHQWTIDYIQSLGYQKLYLLAFDENIVEWYKNLGWEIYKVVELNKHSTTIMEYQIVKGQQTDILDLSPKRKVLKNG
jgi:N-acetylglutamate synthase-like GNAT family acetyltransferase